MSVCSFVGSSWYDSIYDTDYSVSQLAAWVSYQTWRSANAGEVPISLIMAQWGIETGWGGSDWSPYNNPAQQASTCGWGSQCGSEPIGYPIFCSIGEGVQSYGALLTQGYPHVAFAYAEGGVSYAASALGKGYYTGITLNSTWCGWPGPISSSSPRIWAASEYNDGGGPGSAITDTINANSCLSAYDYVQTSNPIPAWASK